MSSRLAVAPACSKMRLSIAGVTGRPVNAAVCRVWISDVRRPWSIHDVGDKPRPLSKTELSALDACATTKGMQASPGAVGSLRNVNGRLLNDSPTRVAPTGLEN